MTPFRQRAARLAPYFKDSRSAWGVAALASIFTAATEPLTAALMQPLIDKGFHGGAIPLWLIPIVVVGLFATRGVASFVAQYALSWAANQGVVSLRSAMFRHLLQASPTLFGQHSASTLTNTVVYEVQGGAQQLMSGVNTLVKDSLTLFGLFGYLMWLNWKLTLLVSVLLPAVGWVMRTVGKRLRRLTQAGQQATDELAYVVEENVLAWRIVRMHGAAPVEAQRFEHTSQTLRRLLLKSVAASASITPLTQVLAACAMSMVIVVALWQAQSSGETVGSFVSFITAMLMLITPIKHLSDVMAPITRGLMALERGLDMIEQTPAEQGGTHQAERALGQLSLQGVRVQYRADQAPALDGLSLEVAAGQTVALVGPSGAGKSTLVHLLPRFIEPSAGSILLDGVALPDWEVGSLRRQFALVSQDVVLFNDSIAANVALGDPADAPDRQARVEQALRNANLWDFVQSLPQGLQTVVGHNGSQLSGGQRQRLAIARALYKNAALLILDEATSALDAESEHLVQQALDRLMAGRTTLVIAHRLATIERADRIVVMDAGRIVEQGPHGQLLAKGGLYARLHAMQFRG
jgi:subfamily B ATP-binding cassette protein MsbA